MTTTDTSRGHPDDELPDGWRQAYYATETIDDEYTFVTAVYEHLPTKVKQVIVPRIDHERGREEDARDAGHTTHERYYIYPVYEDLGLPWALTNTFDEIDWVVRSIVPEITSRADDAPNLNAGPYATYEDGRPRTMMGGPRAVEATFEWDDRLPAEAIAELQTYKVYPLDYSSILDNIQSLMEADSIARTEPESLPDPYPVAVTVHHSERDDEKFLWTTPACSKRFWDRRVTAVFDVDAVELDGYDEGDELATLYLEFQREDFPYDPRIRYVETPDDDPLPLNGRVKKLAKRVTNVFQ